MKKWGLFLTAYIALLAISFLFEITASHSGSTDLPPLQILDPVAPHSPGSQPDPVLLIPGFFGTDATLHHLAEQLRNHGFRILIPDLYHLPHPPGNYSLVNRLPALEKLLNDSKIPPAHLIALGLGGPAAIHFTTLHPDRVRSLTLLSASGTQRFELLGDYSLNKALYSLQSLLCWSLNNLLPDFGWFKTLPFQQENIRSLADIDLRPMEKELSNLQTPTLLIHGQNDFMVPPQSAIQNHRLLPNSKLILLEMNHAPDDQSFPRIISQINTFLHEVDTSTFSPTPLEHAPPDEPTLSGSRFWFISGLILMGTKFSEDLSTVAAGLLVSRQILPFWFAVVLCFLGIMIGDTAIYFFGRWAGIGILRKKPICWILSEKQVLDSERWFKNRGLFVIVISRFVPATRLPVYMATGILGVPPLKFICVLAAAALVWTPIIIGLSALLGTPLLHLMGKYEKWSLPILFVFFLSLTILVKFLLPLATRRGRKLFYVRWQRLWQPSRNRKKPERLSKKG